MGNDEDLDRAILVAADRTAAAQEAVSSLIEADEVPPLPLVDRVIVRAEDLEVLAQDAVHEGDPET